MNESRRPGIDCWGFSSSLGSSFVAFPFMSFVEPQSYLAFI